MSIGSVLIKLYLLRQGGGLRQWRRILDRKDFLSCILVNQNPFPGFLKFVLLPFFSPSIWYQC